MADKALVEIVGAGNVYGSPEVLAEYTVDAGEITSPVPGCVVRPAGVDEVQAVVRWANDTGTPLVPVSSGTPHSRGDTVPGADGAVIVDLSRMNKIVRIDPRNKVVMIEPGVTYSELQSALAGKGLAAYMTLAPRASKSVVGSVLEREPIIMTAHHWDSTDPLLCAEVVFGTGDKFRTGEAMGPDTVEEQWEMDRVQLNPFGHSHVDFQRLIAGAQGTIGIVTWATLKCCYLSTQSKAYLVPSATLEPLIDLSYRLTRFRLGGRLFILNGINLSCLLGGDTAEIESLAKSLPPWVLFVSFEGYGVLPQDKIVYEAADFLNMAKSCNLKPEQEVCGVNAEDLYHITSGPSQEPYWKTRLRGGFNDIFFLTTLDKTPAFTSAVYELAQARQYPLETMGIYIQPIVQGTSCHCEFDLYYDPADAASADATRKFAGTTVAEIAGKGGFFSRPYPAWRDIAYRQAESTAKMQRKVKEIFDPNGVLNPGKLCF
jgi:FAD/FMN-containing dehydrogenase